MCIAVAELGLGALLIWGQFFSSSTREFLAMSVAIIGGCGLTSVWFLKQINCEGWRRTAQVGAAGCVIAALLFWCAAYQESFSTTRDGGKFFASAMSLFWAFIAGALSLVGWHRPDAHPWRWAGVLGAGIAAAMVSYSEWIQKGDDPTWCVAAFALAYVVAHAIICWRAALTPGQRWVRIAAVAAAAATGITATYGVHGDQHHMMFDDFGDIWRVTAAAGLICVSATLALLVFGRLNKRPAVHLHKAAIDFVALTCPRCEKKLTLPVGGALCDGCKLHINIALASTQCGTCGYDLTNLKAGTCPECGTAVPTATTGMTEGIAF